MFRDLLPQMPNFKGLHEPGNIDANDMHGLYAPLNRMSVNVDNGRVVLIPRIVNGQRLSDNDALSHAANTGEHLGLFENHNAANSYGSNMSDGGVPFGLNPPKSYNDEYGNTFTDWTSGTDRSPPEDNSKQAQLQEAGMLPENSNSSDVEMQKDMAKDEGNAIASPEQPAPEPKADQVAQDDKLELQNQADQIKEQEQEAEKPVAPPPPPPEKPKDEPDDEPPDPKDPDA